MKRLFLPLAASFLAHASADVPKLFAGLFEKDVPVRGQIGVMQPPEGFDKYVVMLQDAAKANPAWYKEYSEKNKSGVPMPYDEKLGMTKEQYAEYLKLWGQRTFEPQQNVVLTLRQTGADTWTINGMQGAETLSTLRYTAKDDLFHSPNGDMKRIQDIHADAENVLGAWNGQEYKFEEDSELARTRENIAIGQYTDKKYGLIVYRSQEISTGGTKLLDRTLLIRFPLGKAGQLSDAIFTPSPGSGPGAGGAQGSPRPAPAPAPTPATPKKK